MNHTKRMPSHHTDQEVIEFAKAFNPEFFVTLVFRPNLKRHQAEKSLNSFLKKLNNHFFSRSSGMELKALPVLEMGVARYTYSTCDLQYVEANWHIHLIMEDPRIRAPKIAGIDLDELKRKIGNIWGNKKNGDWAFTTRYDQGEWFKVIYDINQLTGYLYKETKQNETAVMYELANHTGVKIKNSQ